MVFESLINPIEAERHPQKLLIIGLLNTSLAILISAWLFKDIGGIVSVFLTVMLFQILVFRTIQLEEYKALFNKKVDNTLRHHIKALRFLIFLFVGSSVAYSFLYFFLPNKFFVWQLSILKSTVVNTKAMGILNEPYLINILYNNYKLLLIVLFLSFISCSGGIFILIWNASVIGVAISFFITQQLKLTTLFPFAYALSVGLASFLGVFIHGIIEISAYFLMGIAGSIISVSLIHKHYQIREFYKVLFDVADLIIFSVILIFIAGLIEVYLSPIVFQLI